MAEQPPIHNPEEHNLTTFLNENSVFGSGNPEWRQELGRFVRQHSIFTREDPAAQEKKEKAGGSLAGSTFAALGAGGLGAGVLLGEIMKQMLRVDFTDKGYAMNDDGTKMFAKGYDWAYGKKKAA